MSDFARVNFSDDKKLYPCEREGIHGSVIGRVVDTMTRWKLSGNKEEAFYYAFLGAKNVGASDFARAKMWFRHIRGLGDTSLIYATKLSAYEVWYRNPYQAMLYGADLFVEPQFTALNNIRAFIERSVRFFEKYSPCVKSGFSFETDGYTRTITSGDGDYLSVDTLWDMKVLRNSPETKHALQVLMYWIMGQHSGQEIFKNIKKIGIYNPRMDEAYILEVSKIRPEIIRAVEDDVICY